MNKPLTTACRPTRSFYERQITLSVSIETEWQPMFRIEPTIVRSYTRSRHLRRWEEKWIPGLPSVRRTYGTKSKTLLRCKARQVQPEHGSLQSGTWVTTCTPSQGLLLFVPNMYKIAGEFLPSVIYVASRAWPGEALSTYGDHKDTMLARGWGVIVHFPRGS
jgi:hypothetical protein